MPSFDNYVSDVPQVVAFEHALRESLEHAQKAKPTPSIEPPLSNADAAGLISQLPAIFSTQSSSDETAPTDADNALQFLAIETAVRSRLDTLLATVPIEAPEFVEVWNILDLLMSLEDSQQCDSGLVLSLVEELVDSQTIEGCRIVFDYLESRRERLVKHWILKKSLIILRTCNELLRRLSRAEDISFSGRVFIFMFQSFPMGDKGTVNLRGVYHTENVTTWEEVPPKPAEETTDSMEVDSKEDPAAKPASKPAPAGAKAVTFDSKDKPTSEKPLDADALYPVFWSLQQSFSQPTKLLSAQNMSKFKSGLEATVAAFESVAQGQRNSKTLDDSKDPSKKRKRFEVDTSDGATFNPKYLTSRDLFELEMSDLFFRRHILIQAIIVLDFLRSLTASARAKYTNIQHPNKSVMYSDKVVSEEDDKWAEAMRNRIYEYIWAGPDGQYVHRIIQAVTQRDRGWSRWKMETCPPIEKPAITPDEFNEARASAKRMATGKKLRPHPMGSLNLDFLKVEDEETAMEKFKDPARWKMPDLDTFQNKIAEDDFELGFGKTEKEKAQIIEAKASKTWRALRIASRTRLAAFDRIDDWQNINAIFEDPKDPQSQDKEDEAEEGEKGRIPQDSQTIIISGPRGVGKSTLIALLQERQPRVFQNLVRHTTRPPKEGEVDGQDYHFVDSATFNRMSDNDQFLEITNKADGFDYGTSQKAAGSINDSSKVPLMEMDRESIQSTKDWGFAARTVFLSPPSAEELESRLKKAGTHPEGSITDLLKAAQEEVDLSKSDPSYYGIVITNDDIETSYKVLEDFIYGPESETNGVNGKRLTQVRDVTMADTNGTAGEEAKV